MGDLIECSTFLLQTRQSRYAQYILRKQGSCRPASYVQYKQTSSGLLNQFSRFALIFETALEPLEISHQSASNSSFETPQENKAGDVGNKTRQNKSQYLQNNGFIKPQTSEAQLPNDKVPGCSSSDLSKEHVLNNLHLVSSAWENCVSSSENWEVLVPTLMQTYVNCMKLAKDKLTHFIVCTAACGYFLTPGEWSLSDLVWTCAGTWLCSASASAFNQFFEHPYDSQMFRTYGRPLVRGSLRPFDAFVFACSSGLVGSTVLSCLVNPWTSALGASNIVLYSIFYTFSKRHSVLNTWIGAIVGAIPPLMGATARTGTFLSLKNLSGLTFSAIMFAWQFPHFNALSWKYKAEYARAGYKMMSVTQPDLCLSVAHNYAGVLLGPLAWLMDFALDTHGGYFVISTMLTNGALYWLSVKFYRNPNNKTARTLFFYSLWHLLATIAIMITCRYFQSGLKLKMLHLDAFITRNLARPSMAALSRMSSNLFQVGKPYLGEFCASLLSCAKEIPGFSILDYISRNCEMLIAVEHS